MIERYSFRERVAHTAAGVTYVYLLLTGLALWTPALYWLTTVLGGGYLARALHPWVGLAFVATVIWMWVAWRQDMRITAQDRAWRRAMRHYIRHQDDHVPPAGRFNYGQKLLFWVMFWGGVALLISGLIMWFVAAVPAELRALRGLATFLHAAAALATIGGFIVHVYMGVAVVPGGLGAIAHGRVSEAWARHHHPLWLAGRADPGDGPSGS